MKYLKTYESNKSYKFKKNDYVRVDSLIKSVKDQGYQIIDRYREPAKYHLNSIDNTDEFWEYECNLIPLKDEEVKMFKIKADTEKYNL